MQKLPIRYFDTNTHGDIMSRYTNDIDTLSQMISQTIPQFFSSAITIVTVFVSMLVTNIYLTLVVMISLGFIFGATRFITSKSGKYFMRQQQAVGKLTGYVEEMVNGQKVIKVFCREEKIKEDFDKLNEELCESVYNANKYANNIGPVNGALGNVQYALLALVGGLLAVNGIGNVTVGLIVLFASKLSVTFAVTD
jgi:ATP-binding cassette subfamily B protein